MLTDKVYKKVNLAFLIFMVKSFVKRLDTILKIIYSLNCQIFFYTSFYSNKNRASLFSLTQQKAKEKKEEQKRIKKLTYKVSGTKII